MYLNNFAQTILLLLRFRNCLQKPFPQRHASKLAVYYPATILLIIWYSPNTFLLCTCYSLGTLILRPPHLPITHMLFSCNCAANILIISWYSTAMPLLWSCYPSSTILLFSCYSPLNFVLVPSYTTASLLAISCYSHGCLAFLGCPKLSWALFWLSCVVLGSSRLP